MKIRFLNFLADREWIQRTIELKPDASTVTTYTRKGKILLRDVEKKVFVKACCENFDRALEEEYILISSNGGFALAGSDDHEDMVYIFSCPWCRTELKTVELEEQDDQE